MGAGLGEGEEERAWKRVEEQRVERSRGGQGFVGEGRGQQAWREKEKDCGKKTGFWREKPCGHLHLELHGSHFETESESSHPLELRTQLWV